MHGVVTAEDQARIEDEANTVTIGGEVIDVPAAFPRLEMTSRSEQVSGQRKD